jgi:hypothetical protein
MNSNDAAVNTGTFAVVAERIDVTETYFSEPGHE